MITAHTTGVRHYVNKKRLVRNGSVIMTRQLFQLWAQSGRPRKLDSPGDMSCSPPLPQMAGARMGEAGAGIGSNWRRRGPEKDSSGRNRRRKDGSHYVGTMELELKAWDQGIGGTMKRIKFRRQSLTFNLQWLPEFIVSKPLLQG